MARFLSVALACWLLLSSTASARVHVVRPGDSLSQIAERYRVRLADLRAWNRLSSDTIVVGRALAVDRHDAARLARENARSESVGQPGAGTLRGGVRLRPHPGFVLRSSERAFGTALTVERIRTAFDAMLAVERGAPRVRVHDLSLPSGGPIDDHVTHQSGRDVDITYYQTRGCGRDGCPLRDVSPSELDVRRQWRLLHHWLRRGEVEVIYIDRALQAPLYREAQRRGATDAQLARWFQYPRTSASGAVIRHYPNHINHVHVRFACGADERACERARSGP